MQFKTKTDFKKLAVISARLAHAKKAENIKLIDLGGHSPLADYVILATVDSAPQLEAVEAEISKRLKEDAIYKLHMDGSKSNQWRVLDYGGFIVHLMTPDIRLFYGLDRIYHFGKEIKWRPVSRAGKPAPKKRAKTVKNTVKRG